MQDLINLAASNPEDHALALRNTSHFILPLSSGTRSEIYKRRDLHFLAETLSFTMTDYVCYLSTPEPEMD